MNKPISKVEEMILSRDFKYEPPYFYNNDLALRCELGIGDSNEEYMNAAKQRAAEIYKILFKSGVDMVFFDSYICDWDFDMGGTVYINRVVAFERDRLKFCLGYQKKV